MFKRKREPRSNETHNTYISGDYYAEFTHYSGPFSTLIERDEYGQEFPRRNVYVDGIAINPADYGVEDFDLPTGYGTDMKEMLQVDGWGEFKSAAMRIVALGVSLDDEQLVQLQRAVELLKFIENLKDLDRNSYESNVVPYEKEDEALIGDAQSTATSMLSAIFSPLIEEQNRRAAVVEECRQVIDKKREEVREQQLARYLSQRAAILHDIDRIVSGAAPK
jgi:hypothetical protein